MVTLSGTETRWRVLVWNPECRGGGNVLSKLPHNGEISLKCENSENPENSGTGLGVLVQTGFLVSMRTMTGPEREPQAAKRLRGISRGQDGVVDG